MADSGSEREYYFNVWKGVLGSVLGWDDQRIREWSEQKWDEIADPPIEAFYRESPTYWCVMEFIPKNFEQSLTKLEFMRVKQRLALAFGDDDRSTFSADTDWRPVKDEVNRILAEYGGRLPS
jgi:hypothetical protein